MKRSRLAAGAVSRGIGACIVVAWLGLGCQSSDDPTDTADPAVTVEDTSTTSTTAAPSIGATTSTSGRPVDDGASGSGCRPGRGDLPDGAWFGYLEAADPAEISFDLACWFTGAAATAAATEDGDESPPPNDFHVRNDSDLVRRLVVDPGADVSLFAESGDPATVDVDEYEAWQPGWTAGADGPVPVWVTIDDGVVVAVEQQYIP